MTTGSQRLRCAPIAGWALGLLVSLGCESPAPSESDGSGGGAAGGPSGGVGSGSTGGSPGSGGGTSAMGASTASGGVQTTGGVDAAGGAPPTTGGSAAGGATLGSGAENSTASGGREPGAGGGVSADDVCNRASTCGSHKWACWPMPTPVSEGTPNPQSYTDNADGTVTDNVTCLVWEKANPKDQGTYQTAQDRCARLAVDGYGGKTDWRLPTRIEMASITDVTLGSTGFPSVFAVTSGYYVTGSDWYKTILTDSDTAAGNETDMVWGYGTNGFTSNAIVRSNTNNVTRCVSGNGNGEAPGEYAVEPPDHYTVEGDVARDNYTGLSWQRGKSPDLMPHSEAAAYCATLVLGGYDDFRMPTLNELAATVNEAAVGGAVATEAFPDNPVGCKEPQYWFWAAEESKVGGDAWGLSYCDGFTGPNAGSLGDWNYFPTANVRCVR